MSRAKTASFSAYPSAAPAGRRPSALTGSPRRRKVVYLVRHAQAKHNVVELEAQARVRAAGGGVEEQEAARKATLHDPLFRDASLSGSGKDQVALSAADFRRLLRETHCPPAEVVFVSPLERTLQTAQLLFPGHARMICLEALREKRTGLPCDERKPAELLRGRFPSVDFADVLEQDRESDRGYSFRPDSKEGNEVWGCYPRGGQAPPIGRPRTRCTVGFIPDSGRATPSRLRLTANRRWFTASRRRSPASLRGRTVRCAKSRQFWTRFPQRPRGPQ